jgi:undecaprenyl diphosphate synthase
MEANGLMPAGTFGLPLTSPGFIGPLDERELCAVFLQLYGLILVWGVVIPSFAWFKSKEAASAAPSVVDEISVHSAGVDSGCSLAKLADVRHIAVVMDGNRRYGEARYGDKLRGHKDGADALLRFMKGCVTEGVEILTVYAFSTENWGRSQREVDTLLGLITQYAEDICDKAMEHGAIVRIISSNPELLPLDVRTKLDGLESKTAQNSGFQLNLCISYGGRGDIIAATRSIAADAVAGRIAPDAIDDVAFAERLTTNGLPEPDVLLRTSGEMRLSNFLLWQCAYSELYFIDKLWPEVIEGDVRDLLRMHMARQRRHGK